MMPGGSEGDIGLGDFTGGRCSRIGHVDIRGGSLRNEQRLVHRALVQSLAQDPQGLASLNGFVSLGLVKEIEDAETIRSFFRRQKALYCTAYGRARFSFRPST